MFNDVRFIGISKGIFGWIVFFVEECLFFFVDRVDYFIEFFFICFIYIVGIFDYYFFNFNLSWDDICFYGFKNFFY